MKSDKEKIADLKREMFEKERREVEEAKVAKEKEELLKNIESKTFDIVKVPGERKYLLVSLKYDLEAGTAMIEDSTVIESKTGALVYSQLEKFKESLKILYKRIFKGV